MCSLRDAAESLTNLVVDVYGVSMDEVSSLATFAKAQELSFSLLSDPDGSAVAKYDVAFEGRPFAKRVTFILDDAGSVRHIDREVRVDSHGEDLVELVTRLQD